ncbi:hypothetical protein AM593_06749, partial [Mytilus galloprovincialis]
LCNNVCTNFVDWNAPFVPTTSSLKTDAITAMSTLDIIKTTLPTTKTTTLPTTKTTALPTTKTIIPTTKTTTMPTTEILTTKTPMTKTPTLLTTKKETTLPTTKKRTTMPTTTTTTLPTTTLDPAVMVNCDFEADLCNWHQDKMDDGDWRIHSGPTATDKTGPDSDHTLGT